MNLMELAELLKIRDKWGRDNVSMLHRPYWMQKGKGSITCEVDGCSTPAKLEVKDTVPWSQGGPHYHPVCNEHLRQAGYKPDRWTQERMGGKRAKQYKPSKSR